VGVGDGDDDAVRAPWAEQQADQARITCGRGNSKQAVARLTDEELLQPVAILPVLAVADEANSEGWTGGGRRGGVDGVCCRAL
jgi:hypothetical protein